MPKRIFLAAFASILSLSACARDQAPAQTGPQVQLYAMNCGEMNFADVGMFADDGSMDGQSREFIDSCYLIRHPDGDLIWDTGFPDAIADMPNGLDLPDMGTTVRMPAKLVDQLAQLELTPADIEYVSISHMHTDHTGNLNVFAGSTWIVDADERAAMFSERARADAQGFATYNQLENAETIQIEGDGDHDVFGDGSVVIVQTPGHTPGHTILRVNLAGAGTVLLTGDMYHLAETRERRLVPTFNHDREQTLAAMDKIDALAAETNARVIRQHVPADFESLPQFPEPLT